VDFNWGQIEAVATAVLEKKRLSYDEALEAIFSGYAGSEGTAYSFSGKDESAGKGAINVRSRH
jgi:hypothetical protein